VEQLTALYELLCRGRIDEVVIAIPPHASHRILELSRRFHPFPVSLRVLAPDGYENFRVLALRAEPCSELLADLARSEDRNVFRQSTPLSQALCR
jgi:hypothetical protein